MIFFNLWVKPITVADKVKVPCNNEFLIIDIQYYSILQFASKKQRQINWIL